MLKLTVESLAGLDISVLERIRSRLATIASSYAHYPTQQDIWLAYLTAVERFLKHRVKGLDLPSPELADSIEMEKIASLEMADKPATAFWREVIEQIESARVRRNRP
jgi:hypothetical protein